MESDAKLVAKKIWEQERVQYFKCHAMYCFPFQKMSYYLNKSKYCFRFGLVYFSESEWKRIAKGYREAILIEKLEYLVKAVKCILNLMHDNE